jgi:hypothetical protein
MDFTVARTFNSLYIILDIAWLVILAGMLFVFKRRLAFIVGVIGGILYFLVDYGIFYTLLGTRQIVGANPFWFLLWLSMSYGFTNFAWIWLLLDRDGHAVEWSVLFIAGWFAIGQLSQNFGATFSTISISRGIGAYHGVMALILLVGYLTLIWCNLKGKQKVNILWIAAIGIGVQFAWEACLLLNGIRPATWQPIVVNSLIETNLGLPYLYLIHRAIGKRWAETLVGNK